MHHTIPIKPLSVNQAWQGKRYKTDAYKQYEIDVLILLPKIKVGNDPLSIELEFGFSNAASDIDNPVKPVLDIMQKKYGFNDKQVVEMRLIKKKVKKGSEYIRFKIEAA